MRSGVDRDSTALLFLMYVRQKTKGSFVLYEQL